MSTLPFVEDPRLHGSYPTPGSHPGTDPGEDRIPGIVRIGLFALIFSIIFEDASIAGVEPSTIIGLLFPLVTLFMTRQSFKRPGIIVGLFSLFVLAAVVAFLVLPIEYVAETRKRCFQIGYLVAMMWVLSNLFQVQRLMRTAIVALAVASFTLALFQLSGVAAKSWGQGVGERITAFGFHPNQLALHFAIGALALMGLSGYKETARYLKPPVLLPLFGIITAAIVQTGSRGGLVALTIGMLCFCLQPGSLRDKAGAIFMTVLGALMMVYLVTQSESTMDRINSTVTTGNTARRDLIYPIAWQMVKERPILGWGVAQNTYELGNRFQEPGRPSKDTHNVAFYALTGTGLLGGVPFLLGMFGAAAYAWKGRKSTWKILPFTLITSVMTSALALTLLQTKIFWVIMAIAVASATYPRLSRHRPL